MKPILPEIRRQLRSTHGGATNVTSVEVDCALREPLDWSRFLHRPEFLRGMQLICPTLDYLDTVFADIRRGVHPEQPVMMVSTPSVLDSTLAPEGGHTLWLSAFAPYELHDGQSWNGAKEEFADHLLDTLGQYAPNARSAIIARKVTSPLDWYCRTGSMRGDPSQLDMTLDQVLGYRPIPSLSQYHAIPGLPEAEEVSLGAHSPGPVSLARRRRCVSSQRSG